MRANRSFALPTRPARVAHAALALALAVTPLAAELPSPDHVLFGSATREGTLVTTGVVEVRLGSATEPLVTYPLGSIAQYGERFVLRLPMDAREPRRPGTVRPGEEALVLLDGELAGCVTVGAPGVAQELDIDPSFDESPTLALLDSDRGEPGPPPDGRALEGDAGQVTRVDVEVRLSRAVGYDVQVDWATADGTATGGAAAPADYRSASGTITIAAGDVQATISLEVFGDDLPEIDETFTLALSSPRTFGPHGACAPATGVEIAAGAGTYGFTIEADDSRQALRVADVEKLEGDGGAPTFARVLVTASLELPAEFLLSFQYTTVDGTAQAGSDYLPVAGTATIDTSVPCPDIGKPCAEVLVELLPDNVAEPAESFYLDLIPPSNPSTAGYEILDGRGEVRIASDERFLWFVEAEREGGSCSACLAGPLSAAVSPDGANVYVAAGLSSAVAVFARDAATGALAFVEQHTDGVAGVDGLAGVQAVAVTPDGGHLFAAGFLEDRIAIFRRAPASGGLTWLGLAQQPAGVLDGPVSLAFSPDGAHLYAAAKLGHAVAQYAWSPATETLVHVANLVDNQALPGGGRLDGLLEPRAALLSPDGRHLYTASAVDSAVAIFRRDEVAASPTFGRLTYLGEVRDATGSPPIDGLNGATALAFSPDGRHLYVAGELDDAVAAFRRDVDPQSGTFGRLTYLHRRRDGQSGVSGLQRVAGVGVSADGGYVFTAGRDSNAVAVFRRDAVPESPTFGRLADFVEARRDQEPDPNGVPTPDGPQLDGLAGGLGLAVSPEPDGRHLYVVGNLDDGIAVFFKDTVAPPTPVFLSPTPSGHTPGVWSNDPDLVAGWTAIDQPFGVGIAGFPLLFDRAPASDPGTTLTQQRAPADPQTAPRFLVDATDHFVHLRSCDRVDNCSAAIHQGPFLIDTVRPAGPSALQSTSHQAGVPSGLAQLDLVWTAASDAASGLAGYELTLDASSAATCPSVATNLPASAVAASGTLADGGWWAHLCARDVAGNWGHAALAGPFLIDTRPPRVAAVGSVAATDDQLVTPFEYLTASVTQLRLDFADGELTGAELPGSYLLARSLTSTPPLEPSCDTVLGAGHELVPLAEVDFDAPSQSAALRLRVSDGRDALAPGRYRLFACSGVGGLADTAGNPLDGDADGTGGDDFVLDFAVEARTRIQNPNFDVDLSAWQSTPAGAFTPYDEDTAAARTSGSARLAHSFGTPETVSLLQCVSLAAGDRVELGGRVRIASTSPDQPRVMALLETYPSAGCQGLPTLVAATGELAGDSAGGWLSWPRTLATVPAGAVSGRLRYAVAGEAAAGIEVLLDDAVLRDPSNLVFIDGFEVGDLRAWRAPEP